MRTLRASNDLLDDVESLRDRLAEDGYLYLPGLIDPAEPAAVQAELRAALFRVGWLTDPERLTVADGDLRFERRSFAEIYPAVQRLEGFHRLAFTPRLWAFMETFLGGTAFCHPARVVRLALPSADPNRYATRAHQDYVVQHVTTDALTVWLPLTDCDRSRQGLRLIPGSQRAGFLPTDPQQGGRRPLYLPVAADDERWATADFELGDVVVFHSLTVHGGGPNSSREIRLSADVRYQLTTEPLRAEFAHPHGWPVTPDWDELAAGWRSREWIRLDPAVELRELPEGTDYGDYLGRLTAPPSRLLDRPRRTDQHPRTEPSTDHLTINHRTTKEATT
ncbi:ectoine hydroxylase-related dioxygenase (phytanoyl-CoA dioxygenase family) [Streptomyces sp. TLI_235]|nr:phytanoyl-CoA dioxygenase family protein [Streptomyces sp. TLI_235]PBC66223.1 ectoine hydroxylase-related dioxygenase (phytanoyl-CoA dioxygenase family) [Streptomyces sp. TLI_235]